MTFSQRERFIYHAITLMTMSNLGKLAKDGHKPIISCSVTQVHESFGFIPFHNCISNNQGNWIIHNQLVITSPFV